MFVLMVNISLRQKCLSMIIGVADDGHTFLRRIHQSLLGKLFLQKVSESFRSILIASLGNEFIKRLRQGFVYSDGDSLNNLRIRCFL